MNRYQVILSNNEVLRVLADGVATTRGPGGFDYLYFYEHVLDDDGKPKTTGDDGDLEVTKVAEFAAWNGWNYEGPYTKPEVPPKAEAKVGLTGADIALQLQEAIQRQARGDS